MERVQGSPSFVASQFCGGEIVSSIPATCEPIDLTYMLPKKQCFHL